MKKKVTNILVVIIFLAGLSLLLYPYISNKWNEYRQSKLITQYSEKLMDQGETISYDEEWEKAHQYNADLLPITLPDSFAIAAMAEEPNEFYMSCLNLTGDGMMGYVEIPRLEVKIPIYHTTSEEVLEKAAGHLEGSSLPVGGENTHAVISAHRGLPSAELFTDLDQLKVGDHFLLYILNEILCYEVDQILIVEPTETEELAVEDGQDLVTLMTCTPYGVNSHRLFVRGHRVEYSGEEESVIQQEREKAEVSTHTNYLFWVVVGISATGVVILIIYLRERRIYKKRHSYTPQRARKKK